MRIQVQYTREEIEATLLNKHCETFGQPPSGDEWLCVDTGYGEMRIENHPIAVAKRDEG